MPQCHILQILQNAETATHAASGRLVVYRTKFFIVSIVKTKFLDCRHIAQSRRVRVELFPPVCSSSFFSAFFSFFSQMSTMMTTTAVVLLSIELN